MFQSYQRYRLRISALLSFIFALMAIGGPTAVLLGIIAGRARRTDSGAVLVDAPLGVILLFSSLAAVIVPWSYRLSLALHF